MRVTPLLEEAIDIRSETGHRSCKGDGKGGRSGRQCLQCRSAHAGRDWQRSRWGISHGRKSVAHRCPPARMGRRAPWRPTGGMLAAIQAPKRKFLVHPPGVRQCTFHLCCGLALVWCSRRLCSRQPGCRAAAAERGISGRSAPAGSPNTAQVRATRPDPPLSPSCDAVMCLIRCRANPGWR